MGRVWRVVPFVVFAVVASAPAQAKPSIPACIRQATGVVTVVHGKHLHGKRVFFRYHLPQAKLVIDYKALDAALEAGATQGSRLARDVRERLRVALANA